MKTFFQESNDVLRRAISQQIIDPTMRSLERVSYGKISLFQPLMKQLHEQVKRYRVSTRWLGKQNTWLMPETRRYQASTAPEVNPVVLPASSPAIASLVELARFSVPENHFGLIKSFEQMLGIDDLPSFFTLGNPFLTYPTRVTWFLRLSPIADMYRTPFLNVSGVAATIDNLPGRPYTDLPFTHDCWYPVQSPTAANVHLPIPSGNCLRVFFWSPGFEDDVLYIAARLAGTIQSELSTEAQNVARVVW